METFAHKLSVPDGGLGDARPAVNNGARPIRTATDHTKLYNPANNQSKGYIL